MTNQPCEAISDLGDTTPLSTLKKGVKSYTTLVFELFLGNY